MPNKNRPLRVFLCHAHSDADAVRALYYQLKREGIDAWLDKEKLLPGVDWELEIRNAVRDSDVVIVCLSKQFDKAGFRQKEVRIALDAAMEQPEGEIFIIPARLEECDTPASLKRWQWVDLFEEDGTKKLIRALRIRAESIDATLHIQKEAQPAILPLSKDKPEKPVESSASNSGPPTSFSFDSFRSALQQSMPVLRVASIFAIALLVIWIGTWAMRQSTFSQPTEIVDTTTIPSNMVTTQPAIVPGVNTDSLLPDDPSPSSIPFTPSGPTIQHSVMAGESLRLIASCYGANFDEVKKANPEIKDPDNLLPGMIVVVPHAGSVGKNYGPPCAVFYTVKSGDTWTSIAAKYNADPTILQILNPSGLSVGQVLYIPRFQGTTPFDIHQDSNQDSTTLIKNGTLDPKAYSSSAVSAEKDQTMSVKFTGTDSVTLTIFDPAGLTFKPLDNVLDWTGIVPVKGDYKIYLFNQSDFPVEYTLEVRLITTP